MLTAVALPQPSPFLTAQARPVPAQARPVTAQAEVIPTQCNGSLLRASMLGSPAAGPASVSLVGSPTGEAASS